MDKPVKYTFSELLKQFRAREGINQQELADHLGVHRNTVVAWENGDSLPKTRTKVQDLAVALHLDEEDAIKLLRAGFWEPSTGRHKEAGQQTQTRDASYAHALFWNLPYRRNPFFTGREIVLKTLHDTLASGKRAALMQVQAISGLGGIGKTQTAVEYAYCYQQDYHAVLWARADSREVLISDFVAIASLLKLPEKDEQDQGRAVMAVKRWLQDSTNWLLILDNVEGLALAIDFLPAVNGGHTLLTTREQVTGTFAPQIKIDKMTLEEGALFLLRRVKLIAPDAPLDKVSRQDWANAEAIANILDGLPLALDQAGAYIETTACGISGYLRRYETRHDILLKRRGEIASYDHPEPVATTWSLSFEKVEKANAAAAELLRLCAFLHPDAIPEEVITEGAPELGPILEPIAADLIELDAAIGELRRFSLLHRNPDTQMLTVHRLVQAVLKNTMDQDSQPQWAERALRAVNRAFPDVAFENWERCQRLLPQIQVCVDLIDSYRFVFPEAMGLLHRAGSYLLERGQYARTELLLKRALVICVQNFGAEYPEVAEILDALGANCYYQGKYAQAEKFYQRALDIYENSQSARESKLVETLDNLAALYNVQGKYAQAELLLQRALSISKETLPLDDPRITGALNNLGYLYYLQGKYVEAEPFYQQVLAIREQTQAPEHPELIISLNNLAALFRAQGKYAEAEQLFQRVLTTRERVLGPQHPNVANSLSNLAKVYQHLSRYTEAEQLLERALTIREQALEPEHPDVADTLNALGQLYHALRRYAQAKNFLTRALAIRQKAFGSEHSSVAQTLNGLAEVYYAQGHYEQAEPLLRRALTIREKTLGMKHPDTASSLASYIDLLRKLDRSNEAAELEIRLKAGPTIQDS